MNNTPSQSDLPRKNATPAWLLPRIARLKARARGGRIVLRFNDPEIGPAFALITSGRATVCTDHIRRTHTLTLTGEGV